MTNTNSTPTDIDTQIALSDYRQRVLNRQPIQPAEYRALMLQLQRNCEGRAAAMASERRKVKKAGGSSEPIDLAALFGGAIK